MRQVCTALVLGVLAGCRSTPETEELPVDHPANPAATSTAFDPGPNPFAATPTYLPPVVQAPGHFMPGMQPGAGMPGKGHKGAGSKPEGSEPAPGAQYACPMHPEVVRSTPGTCPECGMALRPMVTHPHEKDSDQ